MPTARPSISASVVVVDERPKASLTASSDSMLIATPMQRGQQRQPGRDQRPEGDQQDHRRQGDGDELGDAGRSAGLQRVAAGLDGQSGLRAAVSIADVDRGATVGGDVAGGHRVRHARVRRRSVRADRIGLERVGDVGHLLAAAPARRPPTSIADLNGAGGDLRRHPGPRTRPSPRRLPLSDRGTAPRISSKVCCDSVPGIEKSSAGARRGGQAGEDRAGQDREPSQNHRKPMPEREPAEPGQERCHRKLHPRCWGGSKASALSWRCRRVIDGSLTTESESPLPLVYFICSSPRAARDERRR